MKVTATQLRQNVYAILDEVIEKGVPVEVVRKGKVLKIVEQNPEKPEKKGSIFDRLTKRPDTWVGDPEDIFKIDWMKEWGESAILDAHAKEMAAKRAKRRSRK
jgi:hypothetical protein